MRDYKVKSEVEIKFVTTMKVKGSDAFDAESKIKEVIKRTADYQLGKLADKDTYMSVSIKCTTNDVKTGIKIHED